MKKLFTVGLGVGLCLCRMNVSGDEAPEHRFPEDRYVLLTLSEKQVEEVEQTRTFSLSKDQLEALRASVPSFPKKVGVVSPFVDWIPNSRFSVWPDHVTGIWNRRNTVVISRDILDGTEGFRGFNKSLGAGDAILIDTAGGYWIGSRHVDLDKVVKSLDRLELRQPAGTTFDVFVLRPPILAEEREQAVQEAVATVEQLCQERGIDCQVGG